MPVGAITSLVGNLVEDLPGPEPIIAAVEGPVGDVPDRLGDEAEAGPGQGPARG